MKKNNLIQAKFKKVVFNSIISCALAASLCTAQGSIPGMPVQSIIAHAQEAEPTLDKPYIVSLKNDYKGIKVTWSSVENAAGYYIYRRLRTSQAWSLVYTAKAGVTTFTDKDTMKDYGHYTYMVQAFNELVISPESDVKTIDRVVTSRVQLKVKYSQKAARKMHKLINEFRTGSDAWAWNAANSQKVYVSGLQKLGYDYTLEKIAMQRAAEIALKFSHERPNGKMCFSAIEDAGYVCTAAGENIAYGYTSAAKAFKAFQETDKNYSGQGHRRNMLSADYNVCAIGHVVLNGVHYWVQEFAKTIDTTDYTRELVGTRKTTIEIASEDVDGFEKTIKNLKGTVKDYAPSAVTINTTKVEGKKITLTYSRSLGAEGYEIYRSTNKKTGYTKVGTVKKQNKLTFTDKKISRKKKYYYYVVPYRVAHGDKICAKKSKAVRVKT